MSQGQIKREKNPIIFVLNSEIALDNNQILSDDFLIFQNQQ